MSHGAWGHPKPLLCMPPFGQYRAVLEGCFTREARALVAGVGRAGESMGLLVKAGEHRWRAHLTSAAGGGWQELHPAMPASPAARAADPQASLKVESSPVGAFVAAHGPPGWLCCSFSVALEAAGEDLIARACGSWQITNAPGDCMATGKRRAVSCLVCRGGRQPSPPFSLIYSSDFSDCHICK